MTACKFDLSREINTILCCRASFCRGLTKQSTRQDFRAPVATSQSVEAKHTEAIMTRYHGEEIPQTYQRLVAESVGPSFRAVAKVIEEDTPKPGDEEVDLQLRDSH